MLKGQCVCGAVRFEVEDAFHYAGYCHCSRCRKRTGSAFAAYAGIKAEKLRVVAGEASIDHAEESAEGYHAFCARCHSWLFSTLRGGTWVHLRLGALDDAPSRRPDHHIYVGSKAPWHTITDMLPQYETLPP